MGNSDFFRLQTSHPGRLLTSIGADPTHRTERDEWGTRRKGWVMGSSVRSRNKDHTASQYNPSGKRPRNPTLHKTKGGAPSVRSYRGHLPLGDPPLKLFLTAIILVFTPLLGPVLIPVLALHVITIRSSCSGYPMLAAPASERPVCKPKRIQWN